MQLLKELQGFHLARRFATYKINFVICKHFVMYRVHFVMYSKKIYPKHPTGFGKLTSSTVGSITSYMFIYCKF